MDIGAQLRSSREARGVSLESIARRTRIQARILAAIERNDIAAIPPRPSGRSFVCSYAKEIGLDPEFTVHEYFAQFAPVVKSDERVSSPAPDPQRTRSVIWTGSAVLALLVLVAVGALRLRTGATNTPEPGVVGTSGQGAAVAGNSPLLSSDAKDRALPATKTSRQDLTVVLTASGPCWVAATVDGNRVIYRMLSPGARETLRATQEITIRAGDASALSIDVNGAGSRVLGSQGEVKTIRLTPGAAIGR